MAGRNAANTGPTRGQIKAANTDMAMRRASAGQSVKKGTSQRVSQAKGLVDKVGSYGDKKTLNLTRKQLGAGGQKAAGARKVSISNTRFDTASKKVLGPKNKPLTGRVDMGGGNIAVYKNGVRVKASSSKESKPEGPPPPPPPPNSGTSNSRLLSGAQTERSKAAAAAKVRAASAARSTASGRANYVWNEKMQRWIPVKRGTK